MSSEGKGEDVKSFVMSESLMLSIEIFGCGTDEEHVVSGRAVFVASEGEEMERFSEGGFGDCSEFTEGNESERLVSSGSGVNKVPEVGFECVSEVEFLDGVEGSGGTLDVSTIGLFSKVSFIDLESFPSEELLLEPKENVFTIDSPSN